MIIRSDPNVCANHHFIVGKLENVVVKLLHGNCVQKRLHLIVLWV